MRVVFLFRDELPQLFVLPTILVWMAHHALFEAVAVYDGKRNQLRRASFPFARRVRRASLPALILDVETAPDRQLRPRPGVASFREG